MFGGNNRNQTFSQCWAELPFGFKFLFIFSLIYNTSTMFLPFLLSSMYFNAYSVIHNFEIWRLLIPFIPAGVMPGSILTILINFLWLMSIYPPLEKQFSTIYIIIQTFIQSFLISITMCILSFIMHLIFSIDPNDLPIISFGMFPVIMIFMWYQASQNPDQHTNFCCLPCLIPMKYIPFVILLFCLVLAGSMFVSLVVAFLIGYLQFMYLKRRIIKMPLKVYKKLDMLLPKFITDRQDYVKVSTVESILSAECSDSSRNVPVRNEQRNPFENRNAETNLQQNKVQVMGTGVSIGGGQSQNFRGFWANKSQQNPPYSKKTPSQTIQIQPNLNQPFTKHNKNVTPIDHGYFINGNDSDLRLENEDRQKYSEEELEEKEEKKLAKTNLLE